MHTAPHTRKAPVMSATRSQTSPDRPAFISCCSISVMMPNTEAISGAYASAFWIFVGQPWRRFQSSMMQRVNPPNIIPCTILSAPGKRGISLSGSGCGARVSQHMARKQTMVSVHGGSFSRMFFIVVVVFIVFVVVTVFVVVIVFIVVGSVTTLTTMKT